MIDGLAIAATLGCLAAAVLVGVRLLCRRYRWRTIAPTLFVLELVLIAQAAADVVGLVGGHHPGEQATHIAYLVASLVVLPAVSGQIARDDGRWAALLLVVALVALAVIVVRMETTWRAVGG